MNITPYTPTDNLVDLLLDAICVVDKSGRFVFVSAACQRIFGFSADEMVGRAMIDMVHPDDRSRTLQAAAEIMAGAHKPQFENRYLRKDGSVVHILWSARWSENDQVRVAVAHDITQRKRNEALQAALYGISEATYWTNDLSGLFQLVHQFIGGLLPAINFYVALYDEQRDTLSFPYSPAQSAAVTEHMRLNAAELCTQVVRSGKTLLHPVLKQLIDMPTAQSLSSDSDSWLCVPLKSHRGTIGALLVHSENAAHYTEDDQELLQFVSTQVANAIERQQMISRLQFMAQYDQLTQLPNRELLIDRLRTALARARRSQSQVALLFLDLDKFKLINDTFGHAAGDILLQSVAQRIQLCVREVDTVARFAGDEFIVLLEDFQCSEHATAIAEKIRHSLNQPFELSGQLKIVMPSIGIALYPEHGEDEQQLLQQADNAMYRAKQNGGNQYHCGHEPA